MMIDDGGWELGSYCIVILQINPAVDPALTPPPFAYDEFPGSVGCNGSV